MINTYQEAVDYLYKNLPMFQRVGSIAYKPDLSNTIRLCHHLNNPQDKFKCIHVAGTNGKGSTAHMLASVLQSAGYKTGLYTSPHLKEFTERIKINGTEVSKNFVVEFVNLIRPEIESIKPSFFEITVAMAFEYFAREGVEVAVIEVGLGGRLDSTNIITPILSVITNIGWDHKDILGDTLEKIAMEKAGIIKDKVPVIVSEKQTHSEKVFRDKAKEHSAPIVFASDHYKAGRSNLAEAYSITRDNQTLIDDLKLPLSGFYQRKNLPGVFASIESLRNQGLVLHEEAVRHGLQHVILQTNFKGRWQKLRSHPLVVCDTGHNLDGILEVVAQISEQQYEKLHIVWGMVKDKDISPILQVLPKEASYYFCQAKIPRAMDAVLLAQQAAFFGLQGSVFQDVNQALQSALSKAGRNDFIFAGGSTFVVAEIEGL